MHCLVVDPNVAFATLLKEELIRLGHSVDVCSSGTNALALVGSSPPDLALLDMSLESPDALTLGHQLRTLGHDIRLMLIPMVGEEPLLTADAPPIQGVLPKPFFLPELPDRIAAALEIPLDATPSNGGGQATAGSGGFSAADVPAEPAAPGDHEAIPAWLAELASLDTDTQTDAAHSEIELEAGVTTEPGEDEHGEADAQVDVASSGAHQNLSRRAFRTNQSRIETLMRELVAEVGADGVILTCDTGVLTAVGGLDEDEVESISAAVLSGSRASAEMARVLGREQLRFEQSIAGGSYLLYALGIHDAILAVTVSGDAPLGLLRHRARATAERIATLCA